MKVRITPQAGEDVGAIVEYLTKRSPQGARNVLQSLHAALDFIECHPYAAEKTVDDYLRMKTVPGYSYKIFYDIGRDAVEVVHIRHDSREPWKSK